MRLMIYIYNIHIKNTCKCYEANSTLFCYLYLLCSLDVYLSEEMASQKMSIDEKLDIANR